MVCRNQWANGAFSLKESFRYVTFTEFREVDYCESL